MQMTENLKYRAALDAIRESETIIIHRHSRPDGDAIGSQVGLRALIRANFPGKKVLITGDSAGRYSFLVPEGMDNVADEVFPGALCIILDTSSEAMISDGRWRTAGRTLRFDHHLYYGQIANQEVIDSTFESCCGLIADFAETCALSVDRECAQALFCGMVTDSGRFRYENTNARTLALAGRLLETGVDAQSLYRRLYTDSIEHLRLKAEFCLAVQRRGNVGFIYTDRRRLAELGTDAYTAARGMVGVMGDLKGIDVWVSFAEDEDGVLCELRSSGPSINPIAVKYGGGGHAKASGAMVKDRSEAMAMLDDLTELAGSWAEGEKE